MPLNIKSFKLISYYNLIEERKGAIAGGMYGHGNDLSHESIAYRQNQFGGKFIKFISDKYTTEI